MEDKLNMIYEKLLDLEIGYKEIEYEKRKKELENEKKDIEYRIEDLKYVREKEFEYKREMLNIFRRSGKQLED